MLHMPHPIVGILKQPRFGCGDRFASGGVATAASQIFLDGRRAFKMTNDELNPNAERFRSLSFLCHSSLGFRHLLNTRRACNASRSLAFRRTRWLVRRFCRPVLE